MRGPGTAGVRTRRRRSLGTAGPLEALAWLGPALVLILGVVVYPVVALVTSSFGKFSITGLRKGDAGFDNYGKFLTGAALPQVVWNTVVWVGAIVVITLLLSLALAQFLSKQFVGRRIVRWAVIVPWASALVITSQLFRLMFDYYHGILNQVLLGVGIIHKPVDWLGDPHFTLPSMIAVGVFVSIPFTAYLFLAGLNGIPEDVYEAASIDGARAWQVYTGITLPLLRPAILIGIVLNMIYVFNSFPVIWILNGSNPGYGNDTLITYMYKLAFRSADHDVGLSAAAGVFNVLLIMIAVAVYLRFVSWRDDKPETTS